MSSFGSGSGCQLERKIGEFEVATSYLVDTPNKCMRGVLMVYGPSGALLRSIPATSPSLSKADIDESLRRLLDAIELIEPDGTPCYR